MKYALSIVLLCCLTTPKVFAQSFGLCAIVNEGVPDKIMSIHKLKSIIKGETTKWSNGTLIQVAIMSPKTEEGEATANVIFNYSASKMNKYYLSMTFQGKMETPLFFSMEEDLIEYVINNEGTIGIINYLSVSNAIKISIDDTNNCKLN